MSDIEIAREAKLVPIQEIVGKLILVTAINPTPAGEGKTTTSASTMKAKSKACSKEPMI